MWFTALIPVLSELIERIIPDKNEQDQAKIELQKALSEAQARTLEAQKDVIVTEMSKNNWASNWRAYLMMMCTSILGYSWVLQPVLNAFLKPLGYPIEPVPNLSDITTLVTVGLGGYLGVQGVSTYTNAKYGVDDKKFYDILRQKVFKSGMTQDQVDALNEALKAREGK